MIACVVCLLIIVALAIIFRKELSMFFGNSITRKVEHKKKLIGEVEVLKKEQKVKVEETTKEYEVREAEVLNSLSAQINAYKAQIKSLEKAKDDRANLLSEERKVAIDKVINKYNRKITSKQNQVKKLGYYIDAEKKNIEDVIDPDQPNAPSPTRKVLNEIVDEPAKPQKKDK